MFTEIDLRYPKLNFLARERLDPFLELLSYFGGELDLRLYSAGQLLIIATGVCLLLAELRRHRVTCLYGSLTYTLGIYVVLGWEFPALKFHWFPFWLALLVRVRRGSSWSSLISAFLCSVIWLVSSGALASFGALAAFILVPFLDYLVLPGEASGAAARPLSRFRKSAFGICCAIAAIGGLVLTPVYTMPDYPPGARLAPVSPLLLNYERPLLGPYIEPNPVVYVEYVAAVQHYALRVFLISLIVILCFAAAYLMRGTKLSKSLCLPAWLILAIVAVIGGEWALQGANSYAAPFPVLARLVPGLAVAGLPWLTFPFGYIAVLVVLFNGALLRAEAAALVLTGICALLLPDNALVRPLLPLSAVSPGGESSAPLDMLRRSPSGYLVDTAGAWVGRDGEAKRRDFENLVLLKREIDFTYTLEASPDKTPAERALDGNYTTRWSTAGPQKGGEYFQITFTAPVRMVRLVLSVRETPTDFPRGIEVWTGASPLNLHRLIAQPSWLGPVTWTKQGYPYFGSQSHVIIDLPEEQAVNCIKFVQTGEGPYDWSIGEVRLYRYGG